MFTNSWAVVAPLTIPLIERLVTINLKKLNETQVSLI